jgi:PAS domain-containing protein
VARAGRALAGGVVLAGLLGLIPGMAGTPAVSLAPAEGAVVLLLGAGMLLRDLSWPRRMPVAWVLLPAAAWLSMLGIVAFLYQAIAPPGEQGQAVLPLLLAVSGVLLAAGALLVRPADDFIRLLLSDSVGGASVRRLLGAAVVLPVLLGGVRLVGQYAGLYDSAFGAALFAVAVIALFALFIWIDSQIVQRAERERARSDQALRESEQRLFQTLEMLPVGVFVADTAGRAYYVNRMGAEILGGEIPPGSDVSSLGDRVPLFLAGTEQRYPADRQPIARALRGERAHSLDVELRITTFRRFPL